MTLIESLEDACEVFALRVALEDIFLNSRYCKHEINQMKRHYRVLKDLIFDPIYSRENKIEFAHVKTLGVAIR